MLGNFWCHLGFLGLYVLNLDIGLSMDWSNIFIGLTVFWEGPLAGCGLSAAGYNGLPVPNQEALFAAGRAHSCSTGLPY